MKTLKRYLLLASCVIGLAAGAPALSWAQGTTLNFVNADIEAVTRTIATMTRRNVVVDPRIKGTMTLITEKPVSKADAYKQFLSALRLQGYTVVETNGIYKVVPEADAKLQAGQETVIESTGKLKGLGNQIVTQIFSLHFENANNLVPLLRPLITPNNTINVNPGNNSLIITDYAENLERLARIISSMDVPAATDLEIIPLKHAIATDLAVILSRLLEGSGAAVSQLGAGQQGQAISGGADSGGFRTTVVVEPRTNALIVRAANRARLALAKSLINQLDQPSKGENGAAGNIYVVYLKNAEATKLAVTLRAAMQTPGASAAMGGAVGISSNVGVSQGSMGMSNSSPSTAPIAQSPMPSTGGQIQADPSTNSLVITASEPQYRQLRAVIDKLDARRAQVFVESLIAEVNEDKAASFGVQWQTALGQNGQTNIGLLGTNFGSGGNNIINLAAQGASGTVQPGTGLNLGLGHMINGRYVLSALARFIETNAAGNVLSTPNLLTLDNEEAKIVIGQNVPFVTGQYTTNASTGSGNPFQTIERKDVGLTLRVKPQISENGTVRMTIYQEVSSVQANSVNSLQGLITNKRSIESNVLVEDGAVVVLGGLLQDTSTTNQDRVPGLASIPILGALFRSDSKSRSKTNLMVFLRPVVMRDEAATEGVSVSRYDYMRSVQQAVNVKSLNAPEKKGEPLPKEDVSRYGGPVLPETGVSKLKFEMQMKSPPSAPLVAVPSSSPASASPKTGMTSETQLKSLLKPLPSQSPSPSP